MSVKDQVQAKTRLPYAKPSLRVIDLLSKEVMGSGCKTTTGPAEGQEAPIGCVGNSCQDSDGS